MSYIGRTPDYGFLDYQQIGGFDGVTTTFSLRYGVPSATSIMLVLNGVVQEPNVAYAITNDGRNVVFSVPPELGSEAFCVYAAKQVISTRTITEEVSRHRFTGTSGTVINVPETISSALSTLVFLNGAKLDFTTDYTISGSVITFSEAFASTDVIEVYLMSRYKQSIDTVPDYSIGRDKIIPGAIVAADIANTAVAEISTTNLQATIEALNARIKILEDWKAYVTV